MADITITTQTFEKQVLQADKPVLVDFWAVWCGPCQMQAPILEEVAKDFEGKAVIGKLNVDEEPEYASKYGVMSIPTLLIFQGGTVVKQFVGVQSRETLRAELQKLVK
jgi:thioredoxin 1